MQARTLVLSTVLLFCVIPFVACAANWNPLPDTGQTACYDVAGAEITCPTEGQVLHGQDAQYDGAPPAYQDNQNGTVTDLNTGFMWQQADGGIDEHTWQESLLYCENLLLGGYDDWRLPEIFELKSIVDYGRSYPAINPLFTCRSINAWSATTYSSNTSRAWSADCFYDGHRSPNFKTDTGYVRCVRAGL